MVDSEPSANQAGRQSERKTMPEHDGPSTAVRILGQKGKRPIALAIEVGLFHRHRFQSPSAVRRRTLFDYLICAQHDRWRYGKSERRGGFAVQDHLELGRKLHWEIARLLAA